MKVIKKNYKFILGILIGGILFGSIGIYAGTLMNSNEVTFTPQNNKWNVTKVDEALNSLYSVAVPEEYSGTTSVTPTYNDITLNTQDKLLKNNITISGIPSTYKNLTSTTTGTSSDLATGKTLYNSDGNLITGTGLIGGDCVYGEYNAKEKCTTSECVIFEGFNPSKFIMKFISTQTFLQYYNASETTDQILQFHYKSSVSTLVFSNFYKIENNKLSMVNFTTNSYRDTLLKYIVCK